MYAVTVVFSLQSHLGFEGQYLDFDFHFMNRRLLPEFVHLSLH